MAAATELFSTDYPIFSIRVIEGSKFYVAGGGGTAKTGVPNALVSELHVSMTHV